MTFTRESSLRTTFTLAESRVLIIAGWIVLAIAALVTGERALTDPAAGPWSAFTQALPQAAGAGYALAYGLLGWLARRPCDPVFVVSSDAQP